MPSEGDATVALPGPHSRVGLHRVRAVGKQRERVHSSMEQPK